MSIFNDNVNSFSDLHSWYTTLLRTISCLYRHTLLCARSVELVDVFVFAVLFGYTAVVLFLSCYRLM